MAKRGKPDIGKVGLKQRSRVTNLSECNRVKLPYRVTEGLMKSLMRLCQLDLAVPDRTHMTLRAGDIAAKIPRRPREGPTPVVVDSTHLKMFGEDESKVRQHGAGKSPSWRKVHLAVDETSKDIIGIEVTTADWGDSKVEGARRWLSSSEGVAARSGCGGDLAPAHKPTELSRGKLKSMAS